MSAPRWSTAATAAVVAGILCCSWHPCAQAQGDSRPAQVPRQTIAEAQACYQELDYACVTDLLALLPIWYASKGDGTLPPGVKRDDVPTLLEAGRILAVSHLALRQVRAARRVFRWQLSLSPSYELSGPEVPPRFFKVFYEVRAERLAPGLAHRAVGTARALGQGVWTRRRAVLVSDAVAELEAKRAAMPPPFKLGFGLRAKLGWVSLTGQDTGVFESSVGGSVGLDVDLGQSGWGVGLEAGGSFHPVISEDLVDPSQNELRLLHLVLLGSHEWRVGWFGFEPGVGLGVESFGVADFFEEMGVLTNARMTVNLYPPTGVMFSMTGELRGVTVFEQGARTSAVPVLSFGVGTDF